MNLKQENVLISPERLHLLNRLANTDLTLAELADELNISPVTIHYHLAGIKKALNVKTTTGALKKAIGLKLVAFDEP